MSRLIDADKLERAISSSLNTGRETFSPEIIYEAVDEQPTAFDVDKISKELVKQKKNANKKRNESDDAYSMSYYDGFSSGLAIAIGIVEGGRVE